MRNGTLLFAFGRTTARIELALREKVGHHRRGSATMLAAISTKTDGRRVEPSTRASAERENRKPSSTPRTHPSNNILIAPGEIRHRHPPRPPRPRSGTYSPSLIRPTYPPQEIIFHAVSSFRLLSASPIVYAETIFLSSSFSHLYGLYGRAVILARAFLGKTRVAGSQCKPSSALVQ